MTNKLNDLCILISDCDPDLILVTETWCNEEVSTAMLNIQGYNIEPELRKDRTDTLNGIGGGILVYAKEELIIKPVEVNNDMNMFSRFEILSKDDGRDNLSVTLVYRPPRARAENTLELCKLFENTSANSIFIGDFNFPSINWQDQTADRSCENFLECTLDNNFEQMIHFPTHVRGNILDLFFTNRPENVLNVESLGNLSTSDHSIIEIDVLFRSKFNVSSEYIYDWKNGDNAELKNYLMEVDWDQELKDKNTEDSWKLIKDKIKSGTDTYIPKILRRRNNNHQWMTRFVKRIVRKKQRDYNSYMHTRTDDNFNRFKETEKKCKRAIRSAKKKFEMNIARNGNKRPFNSYIKSKTRSRVNIGPLKDNGILISDNLQMATILNKTFSDVFTHEEHTNIPHCERVNFPDSISDIIFTPDNVSRKIKKLKISTSSGPDKISSKFLNEHVDCLSLPLSILFNRSMHSGQVPQDWKEANVTPIFKKGSKNNPSNYRPVSLTSIPCKLMESIMKDGIVEYLLRFKLINKSQHGFMSKKSCTTNLLEFLEKMTRILDDGEPADIIYLDFSKAFDKVPHKRLMKKMEALGITGNILNWTTNWLANRRQRTVLNGTHSDWSRVISGVPQGSVLGPLLFVIFINDLDNCTEHISIMLKFADDTKLGNRSVTIEDRDKLQKCLDDLVVWADTWSMSFNVGKCKVMHVGRRNENYGYTMNGLPLNETDKERDIGVIMDTSLKPSKQCAEAARRASAVLTQISRTFLYRDKKVFLQLYKQFVRCHLEFAVPSWNPWLLRDIELLERVQRRAVNLIGGLRGHSYEDKLNELNLSSLLERRKKYDMVQVFKILKGIDRVESSTWFSLVGDAVQRPTRNTSYPLNLVATRSNTELRKNFFTNRVVANWNALPIVLKESRTLTTFKTGLDKLTL